MNRLTRVEGLSTLIKDGWKKKDRMSIRIIDNEDKEFIIVVSEVER